jgi:hypothetical protein
LVDSSDEKSDFTGNPPYSFPPYSVDRSVRGVRRQRGSRGRRAVVGFGRINVEVIIDEAVGIVAGERVAVAPNNLRHGHHGYQRFEDQLQSLTDQHAKARLVEVLGIGQQRGIVTPEQADQLLDVWQQIAFLTAPGGADG